MTRTVQSASHGGSAGPVVLPSVVDDVVESEPVEPGPVFDDPVPLEPEEESVPPVLSAAVVTSPTLLVDPEELLVAEDVELDVGLGAAESSPHPAGPSQDSPSQVATTHRCPDFANAVIAGTITSIAVADLQEKNDHWTIFSMDVWR